MSVIVCFACFLGWKNYQDSTRAVIPMNELQQIRLEKIQGDFLIKGQVALGNFERVANYQAIQKEYDVYLYFMKTKAIKKEDNVDLRLSKIIVGDTNFEIKNIYLVSGDSIVVEGNSRSEDYIDVTKYQKKKLLFGLE